MTVTISDFHGHPGPSFGKVTLSQIDDTVAFDFDTSRQYTISSHYGYFEVEYALIDQPGAEDWWEYQSLGVPVIANVNVAGNPYRRQTLPVHGSDKVHFAIAKWIRFRLKAGDVDEGADHKIPAVQFRNIKNSRIVISGESELTVRSSAPDSLDLPYSTTRSITYDTLNRSWFSGDYLTRYTAASADENVVVASLVRKNPEPGSSYRMPYSIALRASGAVHDSADVTINALDAANNSASHTFTVNIVNPGS